jgi:hypothetical protein
MGGQRMLRNSRGNAIIEIVPILALFVLILNFSLGFFGLIHSGILNSIAARNYAFETFRGRADLRYLRDTPSIDVDFTYTKSQVRFHVIKKEGSSNTEKFEATRRPVKFSDIGGVAEEKGIAEHNIYRVIQEGKKVSESGVEEGANPAWVKTAYGICLEATCGG